MGQWPMAAIGAPIEGAAQRAQGVRATRSPTVKTIRLRIKDNLFMD